jgi:hypothetical protein
MQRKRGISLIVAKNVSCWLYFINIKLKEHHVGVPNLSSYPRAGRVNHANVIVCLAQKSNRLYNLNLQASCIAFLMFLVGSILACPEHHGRAQILVM